MFNFNELIPRRGTNSYKWDGAADERVLPLWVADMDFCTAPEIVSALRDRVEHGIFGYTRVPDAYYEAVTSWFRRRHGWMIDRGWIIYTSGVVPALSATIKALTGPGERVLVQTPVYNCFFSSIRNNGCIVEENRLVYENSTYTIDFDDLERKASDPQVTLMLLCNPHNPAGRVWTREELMRIGDICLRNGVRVVADEIHCELVFPPHRYVPFASLADDFGSRSAEFLANTVICVSPSKAFNIAGLQIANIVAADPDVRRRIDRAINDNEVCDVNPFGVEALIAAYNKGEEWLDALLEYLHANYCFLTEFFAARMPQFTVTRLEGTYLVWVDCRRLGFTSEELCRRLLEEQNLWLNEGTMYGAAGEGFVRINIACPRSRLEEALERLNRFVAQMD